MGDKFQSGESQNNGLMVLVDLGAPTNLDVLMAPDMLSSLGYLFTFWDKRYYSRCNILRNIYI